MVLVKSFCVLFAGALLRCAFYDTSSIHRLLILKGLRCGSAHIQGPSRPRVSLYTTIMELGHGRLCLLWSCGHSSIVVVCMYKNIHRHMRGCQNYGPFLGTLNIRCRIIIRNPEGTLILITTHIYIYVCGVYKHLWMQP